jgi:hypothetical protein
VPARGHAGSERADQQVRGAHVDGDVGVERRVVGVGRRTEGVDAGVVDQHVDRSRLGGQATDVGSDGQIGGHEARPTAGGGDLLDRCGAAGGVAAVDEGGR